jgi:putative nucleotidyltransferase with HDIG domain
MIQKQMKIKNILNHPFQGWKCSTGVRFLLFFMIVLLLYFSLSDRLVFQTYDIQVDDRSSKDIKAPWEIENVIATEKARELAKEKQQTVYTGVSMRNSEFVGNIFNKLEQINTDSQLQSDEKASVYRNYFPSEYDYFYERIINNSTDSETLLNEMIKQLENQQYRIPEEVFFKFHRLTTEDLYSMESIAKNIVNKLMTEQILDADDARVKVAELVNASDLSKQLSRELVQEIVRFVLTPNRFLDEQATLEAKEEAAKNVEPIMVHKNDMVVTEGQLITEEIYLLLDGLGVLKDKENYWPEAGLVIMILLFVFILFMFIRQSNLPISTNNVPLLMLVLIFTLNIVGMKIVALGQTIDYPYIGYLAPVALGSMLIAILLDVRIAFIASVLFSLLSSIIFNIEHQEMIFDFRFGFVTAVICFVSIFAIHQASQRATILKAGILISIFACLTILSIILLGNQYVLKDILLSFSFAFAGGLLTAVLVVGLLPFFEVSFGILSPLKLVELSNPNHPLLRKLLTETPGSYHHSVMVGNLSETAAESIGANGLLCRVGSFYHDVGKTKRPSYFIENQVNIENPHDFIEPDLSKSIIIAHAGDGVDMLNEYKMPKQICDIAEQHHGTTLLGYFYHKALKLEKENMTTEEPVIEEDYRYPGPKAQTKEAAIVGISDCVEAAVRSLRNPTIEQIDSMVDKIIKGRMDDNQFNECDLTLKELNTIAKTLKETLLGIFHSRIEYPDLPGRNQVKGDKEA